MYFDWPQFQRCCYCMPLRRGVLLMAYLQILFSVLMICMYSLLNSMQQRAHLMFHGARVSLPGEFCIVIYCVELVFSALLIYAAHTKSANLVKVYYYFAVASILTTIMIHIVALAGMPHFDLMIELVLFVFAGLCFQLYLLLLVRSLLKKIEGERPHLYEKHMHQFVDGQVKVPTAQSD